MKASDEIISSASKRASEILIERSDKIDHKGIQVAIKRSKFEHLRFPDIKEERTEELIQSIKEGEMKAKDYASYVLIGSQRQTEAEGKFLEEGLYKNKSLQTDYENKALDEINKNNKQSENIKKYFQDKYNLNETTATLASYMKITAEERSGCPLNDIKEKKICSIASKITESEKTLDLEKEDRGYRRELLSRRLSRDQSNEDLSSITDKSIKVASHGIQDKIDTAKEIKIKIETNTTEISKEKELSRGFSR